MNILKIVLLVLAVDSALVGAAFFTIHPSKTATVEPNRSSSSAVAASPTTTAQSLPSPSPSATVAPVVPAPVAPVTLSQPITVEQAYQRIPHSRTLFTPAQAVGMTTAEAQAAGTLFYWSDLAIVERVAQMDAIQRGQPHISDNYGVILSQMNALNVPEKLAAPKQMIVSAIQDQKAYLEGRTPQSQPSTAQDPLIQSSHQKLVAAYNQLIQLYPQASEYNKKAFFDHLCALDFT